ncbi:MAG: hypothetical protein QOE36_104 [Gaiellaceae bacterium]|jgi:uncharacterized protein (DUF2236 family)|nr:hypothetical protein [Gaiellaceae bacterium]
MAPVPIFPRDSVIRRLGDESVLMLGGGRALLMQAAHPLVAAGIVDHSDYASAPWKRLARTLTALYTVVHGTQEEADRVGAVVRSVHESVQGRLREDVGRFAVGTAYEATSPELMLWVHSTLVDTGISMYEAFVGPVPRSDREHFYEEMKVVARVFGTPPEALPETYEAFLSWQRGCLEDGTVAIGTDARAIARTVLEPPVPRALQPGFRALTLASVGLLPPSIRSAYGLRWSPAHEAALRVAGRGNRLIRPLVPRPLLKITPRNGRGARGLPLFLLGAAATPLRASGRRS